jgi:DNA-binding response OmpR family regulator
MSMIYSDIKGKMTMYRTAMDANDRPLLILAYKNSAHAARCGRYFRRLGWEVRLVATAAEARRLCSVCTPGAVILDIDLPDESGWLTCAKMTRDDIDLRVILLAEQRPLDYSERLAKVQAAALVTRHDSMDVVAEAVLGRQLAEAV